MGLLSKFKSVFQTGKINVAERFEMQRSAVSGTMSEFHVVRERATGKKFGLKLLDDEKTDAFEAKFKGLGKPSEGGIACTLKHPRLAETFEFGVTTTGRRYLLMEYVEGAGLNGLILNRNKWLDGKRLHIIRQMAEATQAMHDAGYTHRDICPRNFICSEDGKHVKLIDFGLTVPAEPEYRVPGNRTGTPAFMAPEILRRRPTDHRVDIFALGVSAYQLCTFELPWAAHDPTGKAALQHDTVEPTDIRDHRPNLNGLLADAIHRSMAVDPDRRPKSAKQFLALIRTVPAEEE